MWTRRNVTPRSRPRRPCKSAGRYYAVVCNEQTHLPEVCWRAARARCPRQRCMMPWSGSTSSFTHRQCRCSPREKKRSREGVLSILSPRARLTPTRTEDELLVWCRPPRRRGNGPKVDRGAYVNEPRVVSSLGKTPPLPRATCERLGETRLAAGNGVMA